MMFLLRQRAVVDTINRFWRPLFCLGLVIAFYVNMIILPLLTHAPADMTTVVTLCATLAPLCGLRGVEKHLARTVPTASTAAHNLTGNVS